MTELLELDRILRGRADDSFDDGLLLESELEPVGGPEAPVKPAVNEGGRYRRDRRWVFPDNAVSQDVIVIDNVPSRASRHDGHLRNRDRSGYGHESAGFNPSVS